MARRGAQPVGRAAVPGQRRRQRGDRRFSSFAGGIWLPAFLALGFGVATFGAFPISATAGLLGVHATWDGFYVYTAAAAEIVCIIVGALLLLPARHPATQTVHSRPRRAS